MANNEALAIDNPDADTAKEVQNLLQNPVKNQIDGRPGSFIIELMRS